MLWGHRNDPVNFHRCLQDFDRRLPDLLGRAATRRPPRPHVRPRVRPDDAFDRPLPRARAPPGLRGGPERGGPACTKASSRTSGATVNAWLGGKAPSRGIPGAPVRRSRDPSAPALIERKRDGEELAAGGVSRARPRLRAGRGARLPDGRVLHGRLLPGPERGRDPRAHRRDGAKRRDDRPLSRSVGRSSTSTRPAASATRPRS